MSDEYLRRIEVLEDAIVDLAEALSGYGSEYPLGPNQGGEIVDGVYESRKKRLSEEARKSATKDMEGS